MQNKTHPSCNFAGLEEKKFSSLFLRRCCIVPCEVNSRQAPFQLNLTPGNVLFLPICFPPSWPLYRTALCEQSSPADAPQPVPPAAVCLPPACLSSLSTSYSCLKAPLFTLLLKARHAVSHPCLLVSSPVLVMSLSHQGKFFPETSLQSWDGSKMERLMNEDGISRR